MERRSKTTAPSAHNESGNVTSIIPIKGSKGETSSQAEQLRVTATPIVGTATINVITRICLVRASDEFLVAAKVTATEGAKITIWNNHSQIVCASSPMLNNRKINERIEAVPITVDVALTILFTMEAAMLSSLYPTTCFRTLPYTSVSRKSRPL